MAGLVPYTRNIAAGKVSNIEARGNFVLNRSPGAEFLITARTQGTGAKDGTAYTVRMRPGEKWYCAEEFTRVEVKNENAAAQTAELLIGYGDYDAPSRRVNADTFLGRTTVIPTAFPFTNQLVAANPLRWRVTIQNRLFSCATGAALNPSAFILSGLTESPTCNGLQIGPGESYQFWGKGELWASAGVATPAATVMPQIGIAEELFDA